MDVREVVSAATLNLSILQRSRDSGLPSFHHGLPAQMTASCLALVPADFSSDGNARARVAWLVDAALALWRTLLELVQPLMRAFLLLPSSLLPVPIVLIGFSLCCADGVLIPLTDSVLCTVILCRDLLSSPGLSASMLSLVNVLLFVASLSRQQVNDKQTANFSFSTRNLRPAVTLPAQSVDVAATAAFYVSAHLFLRVWFFCCSSGAAELALIVRCRTAQPAGTSARRIRCCCKLRKWHDRHELQHRRVGATRA